MKTSHPLVQAELINRLANICISRIINGHRTGLTHTMLLKIIDAAENIKEVLQE